MGVKANFFSIDALLSVSLLVTGLLALAVIPAQEKIIVAEDTITEDILTTISTVRVAELNDVYIQQQISNGTIERANNTILVQAGEFWSQNQQDYAKYLLDVFFDGTFDGNESYNFAVTIAQESLYNRSITNKSEARNLLASRRMITGVEKGEAVTGSTASAFLRRIRDKRTASITYFGGLAGQGNLTVRMSNLPADIAPERITDILFEAEVGEEFDFYINGNYCDTLTPGPQNLEPDKFNLTKCNASILNATNYFSINMSDNINDSYIAGGFIIVKYKTDEFLSYIDYGNITFYMPAIHGVVNLFDAVHVPGTLTSMNAYLHYQSDTNTYLSIADKIDVFASAANSTEQKIYLDNAYFDARLDYDLMHNRTVPIRFASYNTTQKLLNTSNADIILITDFSGSMKKKIDNEEQQGNPTIDCDNLAAYPNTRKTSLAQCLDKKLIDSIFNVSGNRLWHVIMRSDEIFYYDNPEDPDALKNWIDSQPEGTDKTCISCALNRAYDILDTYTNSSRKVFIILMTDGLPTHCQDGSCTDTTDIYDNQYCEGFCDFQGSCDITDPTIINQCTSADCSPPITAASWAANRSITDFNATIYTVGFGTVETCSNANNLLQQLADDGNGTYQSSQDALALEAIYDNISKEILTYVDMVEQIVEVKGELNPATLYGDSYLQFVYEPIIKQPKPNQMSITITSEQFGTCEPSIQIYPGIDIVDARITSYSGTHWADLLVVNNVTVHNLSNYYQPYYKIGDPFSIMVPTNLLVPGINNFTIETGDSAENRTNCSYNNTIVYKALLNSSTSRTEVLGYSEGCTWQIEFEDGLKVEEKIPGTYAGPKICAYNSTLIDYDQSDAYDVAAHDILSQLDFDKDGKVLINIEAEDLEIIVTLVSQVPYLWGPAVAQAEVWT